MHEGRHCKINHVQFAVAFERNVKCLRHLLLQLRHVVSMLLLIGVPCRLAWFLGLLQYVPICSVTEMFPYGR